MSAVAGFVYLAGAGPGDPELLTLKALRLLQTADVILPDDLVSDEVLELASPSATVIPVGKRCGETGVTQAQINLLMIEHAGAGQSVLRLKAGDPSVFGRTGEEIAALTEAGVPFQIVPGVTAAFAVAATLKTPLTDRSSASKLIFATAHHAAGKLEPTPHWQGAFPRDATLVIYMPGRNFRKLAQELINSGISETTPCVAVSKASTLDERVTATTLGNIEDVNVGPAPVLLLIGYAIQIDLAAVGHRNQARSGSDVSGNQRTTIARGPDV